MSRITRSRRAVETQIESRVSDKSPSTDKVEIKSNKRPRAKVNRVLDQNENAVPSGKTQRMAKKVTTKTKTLSKLESPALKEKHLIVEEKCMHFGLKSPVLRDRTNKSDEPVQTCVSPKKSVLSESQKEQIPVLSSQIKKFFRFKNEDPVDSVATGNKKTARCLTNSKKAATKKKAPRDSTFSPVPDDQRLSSKPPEKILRPRGTKNYCELSKLSHSSTVDDKSPQNQDLLAGDDHKDVPIYKTLKPCEDKVENKEEIYEFPDFSQEKDQNSKKKKRVVKKPRMKRAKKIQVIPRALPKKSVKKSSKVPAKTINSNEQKDTDSVIEIPTNHDENHVDIPENLDTIDNGAIEEAPTIKILSDEKLPEGKKLHLTASLYNQKTLPSEPNHESSRAGDSLPQPAIPDEAASDHCANHDLDMINHSLIRKSMSPITKLVDHFDARSPWRPLGTFSSVKELVQSTPQIHKISSMNNKKFVNDQVHSGKQTTIHSEDTVLAPVAVQKLALASPLPLNNENLKTKIGTTSKSSSPSLKQTNLDDFLDLAEKPESTRISASHGIFDDVFSTPINGKRSRKTIVEANVDNAFGFDDCDVSDIATAESHSSTPKIATIKDVKESKKGKVFVNARVKSSIPSRISTNTVKKTLLRNIQKKNLQRNIISAQIVKENDPPEDALEMDENSGNEENNVTLKDNGYSNRLADPKKAIIDSLSFSDTFDLLSEKEEELKSKVPEEVPLFVDLEPVHFSEPPRRSYNKRKRAVCFESVHKSFGDDDDEEDEPRKPKKKKESKHVKEEKKQMQEWVKSINRTFEEVEHFDLVVE
ncbi:hypothetical protein QAD02_005570 [Eretmocerus hayati]|uniref:Uncharacterized protein n=1 Tax=Eretmocerus hayati TaxID=131215 RepID=A0ACC2NTV1_9HYME|nr:hypothetical protein QAD02_005570 [Eretmocerus hayati]